MLILLTLKSMKDLLCKGTNLALNFPHRWSDHSEENPCSNYYPVSLLSPLRHLTPMLSGFEI